MLVKKLKASAKKCYNQCNRSHKRAFTGRLQGRWRAEQQQISSIISSPVVQQVQNCCRVLSSLPIQHNHTATLACQTVVHHFPGCQVMINYGACVHVFQKRQQLTNGRSLPIHYFKVTVDLQGGLPKNHSYARRLCFNHRKVYIIVKITKCKIRKNKHF